MPSAGALGALPRATAGDDVAALVAPILAAAPAGLAVAHVGGGSVSGSPVAAALVPTHTTITGTFAKGFTATVTADNGATLSLHGYTMILEFLDSNGTVVWNHPGWTVQNGAVTYPPTIYEYAKPRFTYGTYTAVATFLDYTPNGTVPDYYASSQGTTTFVVAPEVKLKAPQIVVTPTKTPYKTTDQVNVRWPSVAGAVKYGLQLRDLSRESTATYECWGLWDGASLPVGKYSVKVRAIAADGREGPWSAAKSFVVVPGIVTPLGPVRALTRSGNEDVIAKWEEPEIPAGLDHYQVRVMDRTTGKMAFYPNVSVNRSQRTQTWNIPGASLKNGHEYYFEVTGCGPVARGNTAMVTGKPSPIRLFALRIATPVLTLDDASGGRIVGLSWNRPAFADVDHYMIRVTDVTTGKNQTITYKSKSDTVICDLNLKKGISGHTYTISVKAFGKPKALFDVDSEWSAAQNYTIS